MDICHGTTLLRWRLMSECGHLNPAEQGDMHVSFSTCEKVAAHFAMVAYSTGCNFMQAGEMGLVILRSSAQTLKDAGLDLIPYSSPVYGEGECDWEKEMACPSPVPVGLLEVYKSFGPIGARPLTHGA